MPPPVRVIGRIDLAEQVREAARSAGLDAEVVTAGPTSIFHGTPPDEGVDIVVATSISDPLLWMFAKAKHPLRPMVAVAERRRERALRGMLSRRNGPDAYVTWPASPDELAAAIQRARASAGRTRSWSAADIGSALFAAGLLVGVVDDIGMLVSGVGLLLGLRSAWNARWQAVAGVFLVLFGGLARWLR